MDEQEKNVRMQELHRQLWETMRKSGLSRAEIVAILEGLKLDILLHQIDAGVFLSELKGKLERQLNGEE